MGVRLSDVVKGVVAVSVGAILGGFGAASFDRAGPVLAAPPATSGSPSPQASPAPAAKTVYACPMHPEVTSESKEDRCPKCGMFLEES